MKKLLLAFAFCPFISFAQQVPNGNFENWSKTTNCQSGDSLVGYSTLDELAGGLVGCINVVSASTDAQNGSKAVKLVPFTTPPPLDAMTVPSVLFLGKGPNNESDGGIPFTSTPSKMKGYYKTTIAGSDELKIAVALYKDGKDIGLGLFSTSTTVNSYAAFDIDIIYTEETTPDTLIISVLLGDLETETANKASEAYVDNFTFEYGTITDINKSSSPIKMFYTIAGGELKFSESVSQVTISDIQGKSQATYTPSTSSVPVSKLNNGMYLVTYQYKDNYYSSKFIVE